MELGAFILDILLLIRLSLALAPSELLILIVSQESSYHNQLSANLQSDIYKQSIAISKEHVIQVHVLHEILSHPGDWTILAVLPKLTTSNIIKSNTKWIILCEDQSLIRLKPLIDSLSQEDYTEIAVSRDTIYFAIKTCQKFLMDRVPVIQRTWGQYAVHKRFYSDIASKDVPTIATGVPNTETGHCLKTLSILKLALSDVERHNRISNRPILWIFLSDDDTILSVLGVCEVLGCFDPTADIYLGERYGFRLHSEDGFNYITGGGGIAFSLPTVRKIVQSCTCPTISSPDDMILGSCLRGLNVKAIHSSRFHQARPMDYAKPLLSVEKPLSFHKFWQLDPIAVYEEWFAADDSRLHTKHTTARKIKKEHIKNFSNGIPNTNANSHRSPLINVELKSNHAEL